MGSRIIAVCDAFDAMLSKRPYQAARSASKALAELRRCSGTQFDPAVVDAFCAVMADETLAAGRRPVGEAILSQIAPWLVRAPGRISEGARRDSGGPRLRKDAGSLDCREMPTIVI